MMRKVACIYSREISGASVHENWAIRRKENGKTTDQNPPKAYDPLRHLTKAQLRLSKQQKEPVQWCHGPIPLPTEKYLYDSSFTSCRKDLNEQFEIRTHKRLIDILEPTSKTVDALMRLDHCWRGYLKLSCKRRWR